MTGVESQYLSPTIKERINTIVERHFGPPADVDHEILESLHNALHRILSPGLEELGLSKDHFLLVLQPARNATRTFSLSIDYNEDQISLVLNRHTRTHKPCDIEIYRTFVHVFEITIFLEGDKFEITTPIPDDKRTSIMIGLRMFFDTEATAYLTEHLKRRNLRTADLSGVCAIMKCLREGVLPEDMI